MHANLTIYFTRTKNFACNIECARIDYGGKLGRARVINGNWENNKSFKQIIPTGDWRARQ